MYNKNSGMYQHTFLKIIRYIFSILIVTITSISFLFAQVKKQDENLTALQEQARYYRLQGLNFQKIGDLDTAMSLYQKAVQLDHSYAAAYIDLGIIYEAKGEIDKAEEIYLKVLSLDPYHLSAYTNLALLYESKRDFQQAAHYWRKRIELGLAGDEWTEKARKRLRDIELVMPQGAFRDKDVSESEVIDLTRDVLVERYLTRESDKTLSNEFFEEAKAKYRSGNYAVALRAAIDAYQLDPNNKEILELIEKIQAGVLSR